MGPCSGQRLVAIMALSTLPLLLAPKAERCRPSMASCALLNPAFRLSSTLACPGGGAEITSNLSSAPAGSSFASVLCVNVSAS